MGDPTNATRLAKRQFTWSTSFMLQLIIIFPTVQPEIQNNEQLNIIGLEGGFLRARYNMVLIASAVMCKSLLGYN